MASLEPLRGSLTNLEFLDLRSAVQKTIRGFEIVPLSGALLSRAGDASPTVLGTLDAIHLASALLWTEETGDAITFLTHDLQLAMAAKACGLEVQTSP